MALVALFVRVEPSAQTALHCQKRTHLISRNSRHPSSVGLEAQAVAEEVATALQVVAEEAVARDLASCGLLLQPSRWAAAPL